MNQTKGHSNILSTQPAPTLQVEAQLDSACFYLDALESTVDILMGRLTAVAFESPLEGTGGEVAAILVPVAQRINYIEYRVRQVEARLSRALNALQV